MAGQHFQGRRCPHAWTTTKTDSIPLGVGRSTTSPGRWSLWAVLAPACLFAMVALLPLIGIRWRASRQPALHATLSQSTFAEGIEEYPAWSADGKAVLHAGELGKVRKIFLRNLVSGRDSQLTCNRLRLDLTQWFSS